MESSFLQLALVPCDLRMLGYKEMISITSGAAAFQPRVFYVREEADAAALVRALEKLPEGGKALALSYFFVGLGDVLSA
eukprot:6334386-Amphidinium_carterae.1